jgi:non-heme chloroperoxidase
MQHEEPMAGIESKRPDVDRPSEFSWRADPCTPQPGLTAWTTGSGPDVVLVHGSVGDYRQWEPIARQLRGEYRLIAVSRRFHWPHASPPDSAGYSYEAHCDDLLRYLRTRERPVHLIGHSYGAGIVLLAAIAEPALMRTMVLIEPAFSSLLPDAAPGLEEELTSRNVMAGSVRALAGSGEHAAAARRLIDWVQGSAGGFATLADWVQSAMLDNAITAGATLSRPAPDVTCADLRGCHVPALVVTGERTRLYYHLIASQAVACLRNASSASLPGAAHMTIVEQPDEAAALLSSFLAAHATPRIAGRSQPS